MAALCSLLSRLPCRALLTLDLVGFLQLVAQAGHLICRSPAQCYAGVHLLLFCDREFVQLLIPTSLQ